MSPFLASYYHRQQVEDEIPIFLVSSRLALKAKIKGITTIEGKQLWEESKFGHIEDYLGRELTSAHRIRIKLESPLGVVENSIRQCQVFATVRIGTL